MNEPAEIARLRKDLKRARAEGDAVAERLALIENSLSWKIVVRAHRLLGWAIWLLLYVPRRVFKALMIVRKQLRNPFKPKPGALDLLETCREPRWDDAKQSWTLQLNRELLQQKKAGALKTVHTLAPYVVKPLRAADPKVKRPLVMHVIANVYVGGSTQLIIDILEHLNDRYEQEVVTSALWHGGDHENMVVHHFPAPLDQPALAEMFATRKPDIVHIHYWGLTDTPWYRTVLRTAASAGCAVVQNINTPIAPMLDAGTDHYVYVSEYVRRTFGSGADGEDNSSVIHPGINLSLFDAPITGEDAFNSIGMVYRLETDKLKDSAIQLFIEVVKRRPRTKVYIVGGGSLFRSFVDQTVKAGVRENFHFTGYVPYDSLPAWYDRFAIFVAPVWQESFGQVSVFGMNKKMAVTGYKIGALPEIVGSDETFGADTAEAAAKIVALLDNRERLAAWGERNHKRAQDNFSVEAMVARYADVYEKLLAQS